MDDRHHLPGTIAAFIDAALGQVLHVLAGETVSDQNVHDARKSLKKARGGLRLWRPLLANGIFRAHNLTLRDAGRLLSPLRDSHSQLQLFHSLEGETSLPSADIESTLFAEHSQARHAFDATNARVRCRDMIGEVREAIASIATTDGQSNVDGLRCIYRKGRDAAARARKKDSAARRHELRKQAKYLRIALDIIDRPEYEEARHRARRIASWLGEDHDLALLHERIDRNRDERGHERWVRRIEERQQKLQREAFATAEELFTEKPKLFASKLERGDGN